MPVRLDDSHVGSCSTDPWNAHTDRPYPRSTEADGSPGGMTKLEDVERLLLDRLDAIGPTSRAVLQHTLSLPDHERASRIGDFFSDPRTQTFAKLLIDLEESPQLRAVVLGDLRERELRGEF